MYATAPIVLYRSFETLHVFVSWSEDMNVFRVKFLDFFLFCELDLFNLLVS